MARGLDPDPRRQQAERGGRRAETLVAWYFRLKLHRVLARRYRTPAGEIDLIVQRGRTIVFVEVKQRSDADAGLEAVTATARRRIARAAGYWLAAHPAAEGRDLRFDVVVAMPRLRVHHLRSAFDGEGRPW